MMTRALTNEEAAAKSSNRTLIRWTPALYDALSRHYDRLARWLFPIGDLGRQTVIAGLISGSMLDVACGTGTLLAEAHRNGLQCVGIDTSRGMLLEARKKVPSASLVQASFFALPFAESQFDYVVETNAVSGAEVDAGAVLDEMQRVCADHGEIRIGDYARAERKGLWLGLLETAMALFGDHPHDYRALLTSMGLSVEVEELGWGGMYQFVKGRRLAP
jgi:ubiquinone/menaquinone biosynthesis C-methylase UbiE